MSELDIACEALKKALRNSAAIERRERRQREYAIYVELAWKGATSRRK